MPLKYNIALKYNISSFFVVVVVVVNLQIRKTTFNNYSSHSERVKIGIVSVGILFRGFPNTYVVRNISIKKLGKYFHPSRSWSTQRVFSFG